MNEAQTVGTRALVVQDEIIAYCGARRQNGFVSENFSDLAATELDGLVTVVDSASAATLTSRYLLEDMDVFGLRRDLRYSLRSRKWLFARGQQTGINGSFAGWTTFVREHLPADKYLKSLIAMSENNLKLLDFTTIQANS